MRVLFVRWSSSICPRGHVLKSAEKAPSTKTKHLTTPHGTERMHNKKEEVVGKESGPSSTVGCRVEELVVLGLRVVVRRCCVVVVQVQT